MPYYGKDACEEVRLGNNIVDVISRNVKLTRRGGRYFGLCPFHSEKTPSFCVSEETQLYHCFGCNESGDVVTFLMKYESLDFTEAIEELADRIGYRLESRGFDPGEPQRKLKRESLLAANKAAAEYYYRYLRGPEGEKGLSYFKNRGLGQGVLNSFGLGYTGIGSGELYKALKEQFSDEILKEAGLVVFDEKRGGRDRFFNRVMFPIMDVNRHVIAFGGRVMGDGEPKYLNSAESDIFQKKKTLYGLFAAKKSRRREFVLCEGYMDVISAHQAGFDNFIATLGTALTEDHAAVLKRYKRPLILCYDSDRAGRAAATRGYEILKKSSIPCKIMTMEPAKDPDEFIGKFGPVEFEKRIKSAKNAFLTIKRWEFEGVDPTDPDELTAFSKSLASGIATFSDEGERDNYIKAASREFGLDGDILRRSVNSLGSFGGDGTVDLRPRGSRMAKPSVSALLNAEAGLLYYLLDRDFYMKTREVLEPEDFSSEDYRRAFLSIREAFENNGKVTPAQLLGDLEEESKKVLTKVIFMAEGNEDGKGPAAGKKIALLTVKKAFFKRQSASIDPTQVEILQEALEHSRKIIDKIEQIAF